MRYLLLVVALFQLPLQPKPKTDVIVVNGWHDELAVQQVRCDADKIQNVGKMRIIKPSERAVLRAAKKREGRVCYFYWGGLFDPVFLQSEMGMIDTFYGGGISSIPTPGTFLALDWKKGPIWAGSPNDDFSPIAPSKVSSSGEWTLGMNSHYEWTLANYLDATTRQARNTCVQEAKGEYLDPFDGFKKKEWTACNGWKLEWNCNETSKVMTLDSSEVPYQRLAKAADECKGTSAVLGAAAAYFSGTAGVGVFTTAMATCVSEKIESKAVSVAVDDRSRERGWGRC